MLRIDVRYMKPEHYEEVGLVDYPKGAKPTTPTLFVGAYCKTLADKEWFEKTVAEIVRNSAAPKTAPRKRSSRSNSRR